ncbi:hypothetical protein [Neodiprion sertifer nucleopolyhedrovirus]|uniref:Uncharacterized protein n=1 Tax=Neodiprion sertifer nucleopolyhedrovirus TaxID=111874 RepID=Q6JK84_9CBAC|nr:hypothetical protein NeseNPV_gp76 [Neodiprion sertifer nucleopolyhedrovirus]AAQ96453.1 hypothetical protein [Neodiprion sertifer nucleopolyhedrovirus]
MKSYNVTSVVKNKNRNKKLSSCFNIKRCLNYFYCISFCVSLEETFACDCDDIDTEDIDIL